MPETPLCDLKFHPKQLFSRILNPHVQAPVLELTIPQKTNPHFPRRVCSEHLEPLVNRHIAGKHRHEALSQPMTALKFSPSATRAILESRDDFA